MILQNNGTLIMHQQESRSQEASKQRTIIVSGVARSGTSMIARVLCAGGLFMGDEIDDVVFEDHAFARMFEHIGYDPAKLDRLVEFRNANHLVWGLKRPHLHVHGVDAIRHFRNPLVILTVRDPVAIAERNAIAEVTDPALGVSVAMQDLEDMIVFARALTCPTLLISYERALEQPDMCISALFDFCSLDVPPATRQAMRVLIEPGRPDYIINARRVFEGYIDNIRETILTGWVWQKDVPAPMPVTLIRDGVLVSDHMANQMRSDLVHSGIGSGCHGFSIDLAGHGFGPHSRVGVKIGGRDFLLTNSGATVLELGGNPEKLISSNSAGPVEDLGAVST